VYSQGPSVHKPIKNFGEKAAWAYPETGRPLLSQERVKLRTSNLAVYSKGPSVQKPLKIWRKRERGRIQGLPKFFEYPLLSQERVKLRTSNLADVFRVSI